LPESIDDLVYDEHNRSVADVRNGNPGKAQSDYEGVEVNEDKAPVENVDDAPRVDGDKLPRNVQRQAAPPS